MWICSQQTLRGLHISWQLFSRHKYCVPCNPVVLLVIVAYMVLGLLINTTINFGFYMMVMRIYELFNILTIRGLNLGLGMHQAWAEGRKGLPWPAQPHPQVEGMSLGAWEIPPQRAARCRAANRTVGCR